MARKRQDRWFNGRTKGAMPAGLVHPDVDKVMHTYLTLNTDEARGAFADKLIRNLGARFSHTWPVLYRLLEIVRDQKVYAQEAYLEDGKAHPSFEAYFEAALGQPFDRWGELEKTHQFVATCKPGLFRAPLEEATAARTRKENTDQAAKDNPTPARPAPGRPPKGEMVPVCGSGTNKRGTNQASTRIRRLRRDHPEIGKRLDAGEFKSVAAAERAARGLEPHPPRRKATGLQLLRRAWGKATPAERSQFLQEVEPRS